MDPNEMREEAQARSNLYHLLGRLFIEEIDAEMLDKLRQSPLLAPALPEPGNEAEFLEELRCEYVRLFLGNVHPYESVYVDVPPHLNTDSTGDVIRAYRSFGLELSNAAGTAAQDHIGLELEMMHHLTRMEADAWEARDYPALREIIEGQRRFMTHHLLRWAPIFCVSVERNSLFDIYTRIAEITREFLLSDYEEIYTTLRERIPTP